MLIVVGNNRSYFTDEIQQEMVAKERKRPPENRWIGQRIDDPPVDLAGMARDYGVAAEGPIEKAAICSRRWSAAFRLSKAASPIWSMC